MHACMHALADGAGWACWALLLVLHARRGAASVALCGHVTVWPRDCGWSAVGTADVVVDVVHGWSCAVHTLLLALLLLLPLALLLAVGHW